MTNPTCVSCDEEITEWHVDFNGEDWHQDCFENSGASQYCCGAIYEDGETYCRSCGDPL